MLWRHTTDCGCIRIRPRPDQIGNDVLLAQGIPTCRVRRRGALTKCRDLGPRSTTLLTRIDTPTGVRAAWGLDISGLII
jgi:hypothetical protein